MLRLKLVMNLDISKPPGENCFLPLLPRTPALPSCSKKSASLTARYSTTFFKTASCAFRFALWETLFSYHWVLRFLSLPNERSRLESSLVIFLRMVSPVSLPEAWTGEAEPMVVFGAIAATSEAATRNTPAEAALAPEGPTHTPTGTAELIISLTIFRALERVP